MKGLHDERVRPLWPYEKDTIMCNVCDSEFNSKATCKVLATGTYLCDECYEEYAISFRVSE